MVKVFDRNAWHSINDRPLDMKGVMFGKWFEDNNEGYFGESGWLWIASGSFEDGFVWIDRDDGFQRIEGINFDVPTHWRITPFLGPIK